MGYRMSNGKRNVECFWRETQFIVSARSFFQQQPSAQYIQFMTKSEVLAITYGSWQRLFELHIETRRLFQVMMQHDTEQAREYLYDITHQSAAERYKKLLRMFPDIDRLVPQEAIASYLGVTPQSLSRIKRTYGYE